MRRFSRPHPAALPIAWIDTETGGLDTSTAALLEIAIIVTDSTGQTVMKRYEAKLPPYPEDQMDPAALAVNGYDAERWQREAPPRAEVYNTLMTLCRGAIFAAHNAPFDHGMIMRFLGRWGVQEWPGAHYRVDTMQLAWPLLTARLVPDLKLGTLTRYRQIPHQNAHSAMADAEAARLLYVDLLDLYTRGTWRLAAHVDTYKEVGHGDNQEPRVPEQSALPGV